MAPIAYRLLLLEGRLVTRSGRQLRADVAECLETAKWFAVAYSALGGIVFLVRALPFLRSATDLFKGVALLLGVLLFYWLSALWAGLVVGLLRPWIQNAFVAALVGVFAALPIGVGAVPFLNPPDRTPFPWLFVLIFACIMGPIGGVILYGVDG